MGFSLSGAMSGASSGAAIGPWGAVAGGILGGFMGDNEPDPYTADQFRKDTMPYQNIIDQNKSYGEGLMDVNSAFNMNLKNSLLGQGLDTLGVQNTLAQRNLAQSGFGAGGMNPMLNQQVMANATNMRSDVFKGFNQGYQQNLGIGQNFLSDAMRHQGDLSMSLVDLGMANAGLANQHKADSASGALGSFGSLAGTIGGAEGGAGGFFKGMFG